MKAHFEDKVVWITGATSGVGKALADQFLEWDIRVILSGSSLKKLKASFPNKETELCAFLPFDLSVFDPDEMVKVALSYFGKVDVLYNNAGISQHSMIRDTPNEISRQFMEVNYFGNIFLTKALLPIFEAQGSGHVVVTSSIIGLFGQPLLGSYAASKHAVNGWYESLQYELKHTSIHATIVTLGFVNTEIAKKSITKNGDRLNENSPAQENGISATYCAKKMIRATVRTKRNVKVGKLELMMHRVRFLSPNLFFSLLSFLNQRKMSRYVVL